MRRKWHRRRHEHVQLALLLAFFLVIGCSTSHDNTSLDPVVGQVNAPIPKDRSKTTPKVANSNESLLSNPPIVPIAPDRDPFAIASRYTGQTISPKDHDFSESQAYIGMTRNVWVVDINGPSVSTVNIELRYMGKWANWYFDTAMNFDHGSIVAAAKFFDDSIYPHTKETFAPSKDPIPKIAIINAPLDRVAGYFSPPDNLPISVYPFSNEVFNIMVDPKVGVGSDAYLGTVAHEYFHALQWIEDPTEETWVNEGLAELSAVLAGLPSISSRFYMKNQATSLINWPDNPQQALANYAGARLFMQYLSEITGIQNLPLLISGQDDGTEAMEQYLAEVLPGHAFSEIYADWLAEIILDMRETGEDGNIVNKHVINGRNILDINHGTGSINQFGSWHLEFESENEFLVELSGDPTTRMIPSGPDDRNPYWWSNRGDNINSTITRPISLSAFTNPTLQVRMWYDIETDWDFGYISVSTDDGNSWKSLNGNFTTSKNPIGKSYGPAYTGTSDGWITDEIDLSSFAGKDILLRLEYVTDEAVNRAGWYISDIRIREDGGLVIGSDLSDWTSWISDGFAHLRTLEITQEYQLRLVQNEGTHSKISRINMDDKNTAQFLVKGPATLVVTGTNTYTAEPGKIRYNITLVP